ncbi:MAG TPA: phosphotransacetylase family protein [Bacillota bacterium]|nr:phosphotransacetylase family protein [Bacillota bacterium]
MIRDEVGTVQAVCVMGDAGSGKTAVCLGLSLNLKARGYRVAFFKPTVRPAGLTAAGTDEDTLLMQEVLGMADAADRPARLVAGPHYLQKYVRPEEDRRAIIESFRRVAGKAAVTVIEGTAPHVLLSLELDAASLCRDFGAGAIYICRVEDDFSLDQTILANDYLRAREIPILGTIFNDVPRTLLDKVRGLYAPILEARGLPVLGVIARNLEISAPTVAEFHKALGGDILAGEENLHRQVEDILVGAMTLESALSYLRRGAVANKALVTGGDRADLALAALETNTAAIILTGGLYPDVRVIARAAERGVPVILVHYDTYGALGRMHEVSRKIRADDRRAIDAVRDGFDQGCDHERLMSSLRLPPPRSN